MEGTSMSEDHASHIASTNQVAVRLVSSVHPDEVARAHGFRNLGLVNEVHLPDVYLFEKQQISKRGLEDTQDDAPHISTSPHVSWFEEQLARRRWKRFEPPTDPLFASQWHLKAASGVDVNVQPAWARGYSGNGVTIAMVDDGLQKTHPDIQLNFNAQGSYDFNQGDSDPTPHFGDDHGTSAGGVAAARDNTACGVGAAFRAQLSGIRLIADFTTDAQEASGLTYRSDINYIYSNSWGPNDDGRRLEGPGVLTRAAMKNAVTQGRNGLGSVYVWAGGNGRTAGDNCNYDGYANSRFAIAIGAVDFNGKQAYYSESCAALIAVAPSSGSGKSIVTSDLLGTAGSATGDCTLGFGGTSAAAPLVAGIVALVLEANPRLTYRDVQAVIINSTTINDVTDSDWVTNGAGLKVNHKYGFGLINSDAAVQQALAHVMLPSQSVVSTPQTTVGLAIQDYATTQASIEVTQAVTIERVEIVVWIAHPARGELAITLVSPSGTASVLSELHNDVNRDYNGWMFTTTRVWGESSVGKWTLKVEDKKRGNVGTFNSWQLNIYGH